MNPAIQLLHDQIINEMKSGIAYRLLAMEMLKYGCDCLFKKFNSNYVEEFKHSTATAKMLRDIDAYDINMIQSMNTPAIMVDMVGAETIKQIINMALSLEEVNLIQWMTIDSACRSNLNPKTYAKIKNDISSMMANQADDIRLWKKVSDAIAFMDDYNDIMDILPDLTRDIDFKEIVEGGEAGVMYTSAAPNLHTGVVTTTSKSKKQKPLLVQRRTLKDNK